MGKIKDDDSLNGYDIYKYEYSAMLNNICRILGLHDLGTKLNEVSIIICSQTVVN